MAVPKLATQDLCRLEGDEVLLAGVDLSVESGEILGVEGPAGSGKTALLRLLVRLDEASRGRVFLEGDDIRRLDPRVLRRRVGLVTRDPALVPGSVLANVTLGPRLRGETPNRGRALALLRHVDLGGYANHRTEDLTLEEARRVGLARTLLNDPEVLLLDDPTGGLDPEDAERVEGALGSVLASPATTAVIATTDPAEAERLAARVVHLEAGRLHATQPPPEATP